MVIRAFEVEIGGQLVPNSCCFMLFRSSLLKCKKIRVNDAKGCQSWNGDLSLVSSCAVYALAGSCAKTTYDKVCLLMVGLSINQKRDVPWCAQFYQQMSHKNQPSWGIWSQGNQRRFWPISSLHCWCFRLLDRNTHQPNQGKPSKNHVFTQKTNTANTKRPQYMFNFQCII